MARKLMQALQRAWKSFSDDIRAETDPAKPQTQEDLWWWSTR